MTLTAILFGGLSFAKRTEMHKPIGDWASAAWQKLYRLLDLDHRRRIENTFHYSDYLRLTARSLEHLATLNLPLSNRTVLEVGAGAGDLSSYFLDRGCRLTITEVRPELLGYLRKRYPGQMVQQLDVDRPSPVEGSPFEVVFCYGVLYHLKQPDHALAYLSDCCSDLLLVSSQVTFGDNAAISEVEERQGRFSQSYHGRGTRFTRRWLYERLCDHFPHVYTPLTQPAHRQFPCDWSAPDQHRGIARANFVAARRPLNSPLLVEGLLERQERQV
jgi:phospholipid N-methyltransferase